MPSRITALSAKFRSAGGIDMSLGTLSISVYAKYVGRLMLLFGVLNSEQICVLCFNENVLHVYFVL